MGFSLSFENSKSEMDIAAVPVFGQDRSCPYSWTSELDIMVGFLDFGFLLKSVKSAVTGFFPWQGAQVRLDDDTENGGQESGDAGEDQAGKEPDSPAAKGFERRNPLMMRQRLAQEHRAQFGQVASQVCDFMDERADLSLERADDALEFAFQHLSVSSREKRAGRECHCN